MAGMPRGSLFSRHRGRWGDKIFEVGSGVGSSLLRLVEIGWWVTGLVLAGNTTGRDALMFRESAWTVRGFITSSGW